MAQHFLKSSQLRDLTLFDVSEMDEDACFWLLVEHRWASRSHQSCPHCGVIDRHYFRRARRQWRCKHCDGYFSVTTRTVFEDRKLSFKKMLIGLMVYIHAANGVSIHHLARILDVQVKTAQAFVGKLREALWGARPTTPLSGLVQIDGGYFGGRPRQGRVRRKADPADIATHVEATLNGTKPSKRKPRSRLGRMNWLRRQKRRVVMVLRQVSPEPGKGAVRTIVAVCMTENDLHATQLATTFIEPGSEVMTDENAAYDRLGSWFSHRTVQHAIEFSTIDGVNDNQCESFFSRLRRYVLGVSHRIEPKYLADIAIEMAWREDVRRRREGEKLEILLQAAFHRGRSRWWRGYFQGFHRANEILWQGA